MDEEKRMRRVRWKCYRYALLSLLLAAVMLVSTGCAALLIGNDRTAYHLIVKASSYFRYPSSIRIESGKVSDDCMFCVLRAKNGYGVDCTDSYFISSSGYPLEDSSRSCYSKSLNCTLINLALAQHFGASSSINIFDHRTGGNNMVTLIYIVVLIVALCLNGLLASNASDIAQSKGYEKRKWFHMCFWLGPVSYIMVAAMPDLVMRAKQDTTNKLLDQMIGKINTSADQ